MARKILVGNWKMNKTLEEVNAFLNELDQNGNLSNELEIPVELAIAPAFPFLSIIHSRLHSYPIRLAAQNCHFANNGAYTGEVSASMLHSLGCKYVILGHSERRKYYSESDSEINKKVATVLGQGLFPILCVGETLEERENGDYFNIIQSQLEQGLHGIGFSENLVIAYEPVWAIGTGKNATPEQAQEVHNFIRTILSKMYLGKGNTIPLLYGGSCNPGNARELFSCQDIDGGLIGGASLKVNDFLALAKSF